MDEIGKVTHYFNKISVAIIEIMEGSLTAGDTIRIKGATTDFEQEVTSMQIEHREVGEAKQGDAVGIKVSQPVRAQDIVYVVG